MKLRASTRNRVFDKPPRVHMRPHGPEPPPPCGRKHVVDMKDISLFWNGLYNDYLKLKRKFDYIIIIYLKLYY